MEQLMMNAIRQFRREHKFSEIRSVSVQEWSGKFGQAVDAAFKIEYVDEAGGEYKTAFYFAANKSRL